MSEALATRRFGWTDQRQFAAASGDWNPMHMDSLAARRTQAGDAVVHGVHLLLWALETLDNRLPQPIGSLRAQFLKFAYVEETVELRVEREDVDGMVAELSAGDRTAIKLFIDYRGDRQSDDNPYLDCGGMSVGETPLMPDPTAMAHARGWLLPPPGAVEIPKLFPRLCDRLGRSRVVALAQLSTLVGMVRPGLHSIFSSLSAKMVEATDDRPGIGWEARQEDPRIARLRLDAAGSGISADATAFIRPPPVETPSISVLAGDVAADEFAGRRALVVGGSRGLGAVTAKLLAAGGAEVALTYARGRTEAEAVVDDIRTLQGKPAASAIHCDIEQPFENVMRDRLRWATHIYYFATVRIIRPSGAVFSIDRLNAFNRIYIDRFHALIMAAVDGRALNVLLPSTVAVDERPKGMLEYAMSKASAEILSESLTRSIGNLTIVAPRLPRILTDQTATAIAVRVADPVEVMLPLLRAQRPAELS